MSSAAIKTFFLMSVAASILVAFAMPERPKVAVKGARVWHEKAPWWNRPYKLEPFHPGFDWWRMYPDGK